MNETEISDRRLQRGTRSRQRVTRRAVDIASVDGLEGVSFGRLAEDLGISKAGIQTLFRTKETLQLATVEAAGAVFVDRVVRPAAEVPAGIARIRALVDHWLVYASEPVFPGGCFWGATLPEFDSHPGPVRDALARQQQSWITRLARQAHTAVAAGELTGADPELTAFQIAAVLTATNVALRLGDSSGVTKARRAIDDLLGQERETRQRQ